MRIVQSTPDLIELRGRRDVGTPLIVGSLLALWPFLAVAMAGSPPSGDRLIAMVALVALGLTFVWLGWPRARTCRLRPRERALEANGRTRVLDPEAALRLVPVGAKPVAGPLRYGVMLEQPNREPMLLLSGKDPARVLNDVARLRAELPLPVRVGWGLSRRAIPWLIPDEGVHSAGPILGEDDPVEPTRRRAATAVGVCTAGAAALLVMEIRGRTADGDVPKPISLVLPALSICLLTLVAFVIGNIRPRVGVGSDLTFEWRIGALRLLPRSVAEKAIAGATVVSPTGRAGRHLLLRTTSGEFLAFPCDGAEGTAAAERIRARAGQTASA